jgi:transcriptional regulator with XRE-family HTH domain
VGVADNIDPMTSLWHWLAYDVRRFRIAAGLSQPKLGRILGIARQTVCNIEAAERRLTDKQARILDDLWETGGHFRRLLTYARRGHDPKWLQAYYSYEDRSKMIKLFGGMLIPGLLQTPEYAKALFLAGRWPNVDAAVEARMRRQEILRKPNPPELWILLDWSALERPVGGVEVMRVQLSKLLELAVQPYVSLRVVPKSAGAHVGLDGAFRVTTVKEGDVGYAEAPHGGRLILDSDEVRSFVARFDRIGAQALPEVASRNVIADVMESMK